jgi:3-hydroxyisobutyrate dehydrogenase-like beta-hydroxyacid dehydrogenase
MANLAGIALVIGLPVLAVVAAVVWVADFAWRLVRQKWLLVGQDATHTLARRDAIDCREDFVRIGFIGLGDMGQGIVPRLLDAGHRVTGWNRTRNKAAPLIDMGMEWAETPRQTAKDAEVVLSIVTDATAVEAVALGDDGVLAGLGPEGVYADMSTVDPDASRKVSAAFAASGRVMLDAPLSGSPVSLEQDKASVMVGGDHAAFERVRPVLEAIGPNVTYIGPSGMAVQMKVAINLCLIVEIVAFSEAVALAEKGGVDRAVAVDAMLKSVVASPVMGYRGPFILEGGMPEKPLADVTLQQKDMLLALELGRRQGSPVPLAAAANEMLNACHGLGLSHRDFVTVFDVYRSLGGKG